MRRGQQKFDEQAYLRELQVQVAEQKRRKEVRGSCARALVRCAWTLRISTSTPQRGRTPLLAQQHALDGIAPR
jgi:hypothetical protein